MSSREYPKVICVRSFVPNEKNSAEEAMRSAVFRRGALDKAVKQLGLDGFTPHSFRHTAASLAIAAGAVARKPRRTRPLVIVGLVGFVLALGGILALALPFF